MAFGSCMLTCKHSCLQDCDHQQISHALQTGRSVTAQHVQQRVELIKVCFNFVLFFVSSHVGCAAAVPG
jgi:hypothetical protein